jgi:hypothetical protein
MAIRFSGTKLPDQLSFSTNGGINCPLNIQVRNYSTNFPSRRIAGKENIQCPGTKLPDQLAFSTNGGKWDFVPLPNMGAFARCPMTDFIAATCAEMIAERAGVSTDQVTCVITRGDLSSRRLEEVRESIRSTKAESE